MNQPIRPQKLRLYNALKIGYFRNEAKQRKRLKRFGYRLDPQFTTRDHMVAYNPYSKKLLFVSNGTQPTNMDDLAADLVVGLGSSPKYNKRIDEQKNALLKAKERYGVNHATIVGHSLGGNTGHFIGSADDKIISYNPALINQKARTNETILKTKNDPVSAFANDGKILASSPDTVIGSHSLENIRNAAIFI
jgi:predicted alpha/beta superfamily hydrolase